MGHFSSFLTLWELLLKEQVFIYYSIFCQHDLALKLKAEKKTHQKANFVSFFNGWNLGRNYILLEGANVRKNLILYCTFFIDQNDFPNCSKSL